MTRYAILFLISLAVFAGWENIQINDNDAGSMTGRVMYFGADYEAAVDDDYQWDDSGKILTVTGTVSATTISVSDDAYDATWNASTDVPTKNAVYDKIESLAIGGDVSKVGTPVNNQIGVWTGDGTIEGDPALTFDTTDDTFAIAAGGNLAFGAIDIIADVAGTTNLKNIDGIDTTTKNTIQTAIDSLGTVSATTISVSDDAYAAGWNGSTDVPTKNALYDKIEETVEYSRETSAGTGLVDGGILTIGTGGAGVATTFSISDGYGYVLNTSTPGSPTLTKVSWTGKTDISVTNIATQLITFVCINSAGTVVQSASEWGQSEYRSCIIIGVVVHVNNTTVDAVNNRQVPVNHLHSNVADLFEAVGFINLSGNTLSGNPDVSLNIQKSAGVLFGHGINYANNVDDPNQLTLAARGTGAGDKSTFQYRLSDGTYGTGGDAPYASLTNEAVHPTRYESATGVLSTVSPNKWTVQRVYGFTSNNIKVQYGTAEYATSSEAQAAISTEAFVTEPSIEANGILWGYMVIDEGCASLTDALTVVFIPAGKFGSSGGGGGGGGTTDHGALTGLGDDDHTQYILHTELDTEAKLESALTDVTNVFTNNDGALNDDDVTAIDVGLASANLDDTDASIEWEDAAGLDADGGVSTGHIGPTELASTSVAPGSYTHTSLTVDADGRITSASSGIDDDQPDNDSEVPDAITVSAGTVINTDFTLKQSAAPVPTAEGRVEWDIDDNFISIGDGLLSRKFSPDDALDTEAELESRLTDVTNVFTNNDVIPVGNLNVLGADTSVATGTAGTSGNLAEWNVDGDLVDSSVVAADVKTTRTGIWRNVWLSAAGWRPDTTTGPQETNQDEHDVRAFDGATSETARYQLAMPYTWDAGTIKVEFYWLAATGASPADGVAWEISGASVANDEVWPPTTGTAIQTTDTVTAVGDLHIVKSASITITGAAAGELVELELFRDHDDAGDTMTEDALLLGVLLWYQESSTEPSAP